eukprot:s2269_g6.t1
MLGNTYSPSQEPYSNYYGPPPRFASWLYAWAYSPVPLGCPPAPRHDSGVASPRALQMAVLCLPDLSLHRGPDEERPLWAKMLTASEEQARWSAAAGASTARTSLSRSRRNGSLTGPPQGLQDFLDSPRRSCRPVGRHSARIRPTQRQAVDDETSVPAEIYQAMLQLGQEARARSVHRKAYQLGTGQPFLEHRDAAELREQRRREEARAASLPPEVPAELAPSFRRAASCAAEVMERHWGAPVPAVPILPVPLPLQVV